MIEKQVKTKYFDTNTRFVDLTSAATRQTTFNKMFVTGDDPTPVQSIDFDPVINLATCACANHKFNKYEVVEFTSGLFDNNQNMQFRIIDVINDDTFTFAYFDIFDVNPDLAVKLPGAGWIGADGAYTSKSSMRIAINFTNYQTNFYLNSVIQMSTASGHYLNLTKFRFFVDDIGFYNFNNNGVNIFNYLIYAYGMSQYNTTNYNIAHISMSGGTGVWSNGSTMQRILANYDGGAPTIRGGELLLQHPLLFNNQQQAAIETPILIAARGRCVDESITIDGVQYVLVSDAASTYYMRISNWDRTNV